MVYEKHEIRFKILKIKLSKLSTKHLGKYQRNQSLNCSLVKMWKVIYVQVKHPFLIKEGFPAGSAMPYINNNKYIKH